MKEVKGIWLPDGDTHFKSHLEKGPLFDGKGTYQLKKIQAALSLIPENRRKLAVDVGAHVGLWSRVLANYFDKVVAYEPVPEFVECFTRNCPGNVVLHQRALSDKTGTLHMDVCADNSGNTHVIVPGRQEGASLHVKCDCLDNAKFGHPIDFLKIDVEGWEYAVVEGGLRIIQRDKPIVVVEQKPGHAERFGLERTAAVKLLRDNDYTEMWEISGDHCLMHKSQVT